MIFFAESIAVSSVEHTLASTSSACTWDACKYTAMLETEVLEILVAVSI